MLSKSKIALLAGLAMTAITPAIAGTPVPETAWVNAVAADGAAETKAFAGLNWTFGSSPTPEFILGVVHSQTMADGTVQGAKASVFLDATGGFALDKVKFTGLYGAQDVQAELGFGYNFQNGAGFGVVGANGSYFAGGVDIYRDMSIEAFFAAHSIGDFGDGGYNCDGVEAPSAPWIWLPAILDGERCRFDAEVIINPLD